ncbi:MAG: nicotinic acid mononucleotide adenylyltransferase [Alphaproteobacteria bacterium PA4]|nr:MAG: nicotinic acid mononucleotide adenylyltransferase [Alphaproteobacteria bacterium PA4]
MRRIGLLGGSFNPAHAGHRLISLEALRLLGLDEVWWLVSPQNPLKSPAEMAPLAARLASAQAVADDPRLRVLAIESQLGTRYTIDTVTRLLARWPADRFIWLMGADILPELHRWRRWRDLARRLPLAELARPGHGAAPAPALAWLGRWQRPAAEAMAWPHWPLPALVRLASAETPESATAIRARDPQWAAAAKTATDAR